MTLDQAYTEFLNTLHKIDDDQDTALRLARREAEDRRREAGETLRLVLVSLLRDSTKQAQ